MCGIAGYIDLTQPADQTLIEAMTRTMEHRGPDGEGYFLDGPLALGHRRLSIIDLAGGKQPMADLREGKITLPLILTLKRCSVGERELVGKVLKSAAQLADENGGLAPLESPDLELAPVAEIVTRYRGLADTLRRAEDHVSHALAAIAPFPEGPAKDALRAAAQFSVARDR